MTESVWTRHNRILIPLAILSLAAWGVLVWQARAMGSQSMGLTMGLNFTLFLALWVAMMIAMMAPAAAPMIMIFGKIQAGKQQRDGTAIPVWLFAGTYLTLWAAVGIVAYLGAIAVQQLGDHVMWVADNGPRLAGLLLIAAGVYQVTPLKRVCLAKCRSPLAFLMGSWRDGIGGALRMGLTHGVYCLGCCWLFFAILFPLGMMNLAALAIITVVVFAEKTLPGGTSVAWVAAAVLVAYGLAVLVSPGLLPVQPPQRMQM